MPDWSYQTLSKPLLFRLPAARARNFCLRVMGSLARFPLGGKVIDFLGHMRPNARLECVVAGVSLASPVGLGGRLDPNAEALGAFAHFGFGFLEVGPISVTSAQESSAVDRGLADESFRFASRDANRGLDWFVKRLEDFKKGNVPMLVRLAVDEQVSAARSTRECETMIESLSAAARWLAIDTLWPALAESWSETEWGHHCEQLLLVAAPDGRRVPLLVCMPADVEADSALRLARIAIDTGFAGIVFTGEVAGAGDAISVGGLARERVVAQVALFRQALGEQVALIASGGVHEPAHALDLMHAGANAVQLDTGLVYAGPGLAKRTNDAILFDKREEEDLVNRPAAAALRATELDWFWSLLMGLGMLIGGLLAIVIASTRVVLPYDEDFVCMSIEQLIALNDRLLSFMSHDRVSLSGTMLAIGVVYVIFSWFGMRAGLHWSRVAVLASAFAGFGSFFLFLGFGYFDPFHAFVTAILFQFLLLSVHSRARMPDRPSLPNLHNDRKWKLAQWGQLLLLVHGGALMTAGMVISGIGATHVFVAEDLQFMQTTTELLAAANPKIIPLIAHDRASFGGMILAAGVATFLAALWGFAQGRRWLWWAFALAGIVAYLPAIVVHYAVSYVNDWHLAPAYGGMLLLASGLALSWPYLCCATPVAAADWAKYRYPEGTPERTIASVPQARLTSEVSR